jgi:uncharacterized membrane protein
MRTSLKVFAGLATLAMVGAGIQLATAANAAVGPTGAPVELSPLGGSGYSSAYGMNDKGQVVGDSNFQAVVWTNRQIKALPLPANSIRSVAAGINNNGVIVGFDVNSATGLERALRWNTNGTVTVLAPNYVNRTEAFDINDQGQVLGLAYPLSGSGIAYPARFSGGGVVRVAQPVSGGATPGGISNHTGTNLIAGTVTCSHSGCTWITTAYEIGTSPNGGHGMMTLPGLGASMHFDTTTGVSTGGHTIAGGSETPDRVMHPVLWRLTGTTTKPVWKIQNLTPGSTVPGEALAISPNAKFVTGYTDNHSAAFFWDATGGPRTLPKVAGQEACTSYQGMAVDSLGNVAGQGCGSTGQGRALLWVAS